MKSGVGIDRCEREKNVDVQKNTLASEFISAIGEDNLDSIKNQKGCSTPLGESMMAVAS